jgi:hypothetical protein
LNEGTTLHEISVVFYRGQVKEGFYKRTDRGEQRMIGNARLVGNHTHFPTSPDVFQGVRRCAPKGSGVSPLAGQRSKPGCGPRECDVVAQITDLCVRADRQPGLALIQSLQERCGGLIDDPGLTLPP